MNKMLVSVIVVIALLGLVGSIMVIAVVGSALGIVLISAPVTSSQDFRPEPTITAANTHRSADLDGTEWVLTSLNGGSPLAGAEVTLAFGSGQASGSAGCNSYSGPYRVEGEDGLAFSHIASTEMACLEPEGIMEQEADYLNALREAARFRLSEGQLEISTARGDVLIYGPAPKDTDVSLEGITWTLTTFIEGRTATSLLAETEITATFEGGTVGGWAGCNSYSAAYTFDGSFFTVETPAATAMACGNPVGVMEQEQRYLSFLEDVTAHSIDGSQLQLETGDGRALIFAVQE